MTEQTYLQHGASIWHDLLTHDTGMAFWANVVLICTALLVIMWFSSVDKTRR